MTMLAMMNAGRPGDDDDINEEFEKDDDDNMRSDRCRQK